MSQPIPREVSFTGVRVTLDSHKSFDDLTAALLDDVGDKPASLSDYVNTSADWDQYQEHAHPGELGDPVSTLTVWSSTTAAPKRKPSRRCCTTRWRIRAVLTRWRRSEPTSVTTRASSTSAATPTRYRSHRGASERRSNITHLADTSWSTTSLTIHMLRCL